MLAAPVAVLVIVACGDDEKAVVAATPDAAACAAGYLGDSTQPIQMELRTLLADGGDVPIHDGDDLDVLFPPQGGRVAFVGVRATNLDGCGLQITGALRDPTTQQIRLDGRTVNLVREPDGWGTTGEGTDDIVNSGVIGNYSNIPLCPNEWASTDLYDQPFDLEVVVTDHEKKTLTQTIHVTPRCVEPGAKLAECKCICKKDYVLGASCGDAG